METIFKSENQAGVTIEVHRSTKGVFSYDFKVNASDIKEVLRMSALLTQELNAMYPQETEK